MQTRTLIIVKAIPLSVSIDHAAALLNCSISYLNALIRNSDFTSRDWVVQTIKKQTIVLLNPKKKWWVLNTELTEKQLIIKLTPNKTQHLEFLIID